MSVEDANLWREIVRTITPLHKRKPPLGEFSSMLEEQEKSSLVAGKQKQTTSAPYQPSISRAATAKSTARLDDVTARKLKKGKITIDARIDLHGMTQIRAHDALFGFLQNAREGQKRMVLVITGKGRTGDGVLRRAVPLWLSEAPFSAIVSSWREAGISHGGDGALYVRLRRDRYSAMP